VTAAGYHATAAMGHREGCLPMTIKVYESAARKGNCGIQIG